jgi:hypothetical protein
MCVKGLVSRRRDFLLRASPRRGGMRHGLPDIGVTPNSYGLHGADLFCKVPMKWIEYARSAQCHRPSLAHSVGSSSVVISPTSFVGVFGNLQTGEFVNHA